MKNTIKSYLGFKLFLLLTGVIVLSVIPTTYTALKAISDYGHEVAELNEQQIRHQAFSYLREVTRERAGRYRASFDRIAASAGMLGSQASTIYSNLTYYSDSPLEDYQFHVYVNNGFLGNSMEDPVVSLYWGSADLSLDIKSELLVLTHMTPLFQRVLVDNPEVLASHSISVSGIGQYCTNNLKGRQVAFDLPPVSLFDLREGEPMTIFTESEVLRLASRSL